MNNLFHRMSCLSVSKEFKKLDIYESFFDKKVDKRYLEVAIQRFIDLNQKMLEFLGIEIIVHGANETISLSFRSSKYIGAVPLRMPYDGIARKDFQIVPRFGNGKNMYYDLTQILAKLDYSILPEHSVEKLCNYTQLRPPLYLEAIKYIDLFAAAYHYPWRKFNIKSCSHAYPKSNTNWRKYALSSSNPQNMLVFPSNDSVLTTNHDEWKKLRYVFDLASSILKNPDTPPLIRYGYQAKANDLMNRLEGIYPKFTRSINISAHDPYNIIKLKKQANILLNYESKRSTAWRIDMAELFERYVQTVVERATQELSAFIYRNGKVHGKSSKGHIPSWGLSYLEPDIMIRLGNRLYMADAKYKANYYTLNKISSGLKTAHRADLHQILAYSSFEPQSNTTSILFYPANTTSFRIIDYSANNFGGTDNKIVLCGLAFGSQELEQAPQKVKEIFQNNLAE